METLEEANNSSDANVSLELSTDLRQAGSAIPPTKIPSIPASSGKVQPSMLPESAHHSPAATTSTAMSQPTPLGFYQPDLDIPGGSPINAEEENRTGMKTPPRMTRQRQKIISRATFDGGACTRQSSSAKRYRGELKQFRHLSRYLRSSCLCIVVLAFP
jgi:hypothetical protein